MDLSKPTDENISFMITSIKEKLRLVNADAMKPEHFDINRYDDLRDLYEMVQARKSFSPNEMQAIASELASLRK
ncbi:DUF1128 domain-containing protein [Indiicoccus explosivorum]|uniref:DUF1128 domain-containing protein n=1 Tax=Indiicoccus explosivorum TaxID=1917864 RepID=UPI000B441AEF|nr:DUF1128 domain-containing protein [Indiicoccus explosivorum]